MENENQYSVKIYPYLASSPRLIEGLVILGYHKEILEDIDNFKKCDIKLGGKYDTYKTENESITILNCIINDNANIPINLEMIPELVFPKEESFINVYHLESNDENLISPYSVISYFNHDNLKGDSKITIYYYAYVFYEKINIKHNLILAVKKSFCIISQYPYFNFYYNLLSKLVNIMKSDVEFPLEIIIHNFVNYIPSPLYNDIVINFEKLLRINTNISKSKIASENNQADIENSKKKDFINTLKLLSKNEEVEKFNSAYFERLASLMEDAMYKENLESEKEKSIYVLKAQTGYPICDFISNSIFHLLSKNIIIQIFIFSFLEIDILFFSENIEKLNFLMYAFALTSYPCTDSQYLWNIATISRKELESGVNSLFLNKPFTSMLGVNDRYNSSIKTIKFSRSHFVVDIDEQKMFFKSYGNNEQDEPIRKLFDFISESNLSNSNKNSYNFLANQISELNNFFEDICKKLIKKSIPFMGNNLKDIKTNMFNLRGNGNFYFFQESCSINACDNSFMEYCYNFILNILNFYYKSFNMSFDEENDKIVFKKNKDLSAYSEEEKIFLNLFGGTFKCQSFFENFLISRKCLDTYKVPYILTEEFLYLKRKMNLQKFYQISFLVIDSYYQINNTQSFEMNFDLFNLYLMKNIKEIGGEEIENENEGESKSHKNLYQNFKNILMRSSNIKKISQTQTCRYKRIILDNEILIEYKYLISNEKLNEIFPTLDLMKNQSASSTKLSDINDFIEKIIISIKSIQSQDLLVIGYLMISLLFIDQYGLEIDNIKYFLNNLKFSQKKYIQIYQRMLLNLIKKNIKINANSIDLQNDFYYMDKINSCLFESKLLPDLMIINNLEEFHGLKVKYKTGKSDKLISKHEDKKDHIYCDIVTFKIAIGDKVIDDQEEAIKQIFILASNITFNGEYNLSPSSGKGTKLKVYVDEAEVYSSKLVSPFRLYIFLNVIVKRILDDPNYIKTNRSILIALCNIAFYLRYEEIFKDINLSKLYKILLHYLSIHNNLKD